VIRFKEPSLVDNGKDEAGNSKGDRRVGVQRTILENPGLPKARKEREREREREREAY